MAQDDAPPTAFSPLAELGITKAELRDTVLDAFLSRECVALPSSADSFDGCGVYAVYYYGDDPYYEPISNTRHETTVPIYVGTATPSDSGEATHVLHASAEPALATRLAEHRASIEQADNLAVSEFRCRYIPLGEVWTRYAEQLLLSAYAPWWNRYITGFEECGGDEEASEELSLWDELHPGRMAQTDEPENGRDDVWEECVQPRIQRAKDDRTYKDRGNLDDWTLRSAYAPAVEEASLFEFSTRK